MIKRDTRVQIIIVENGKYVLLKHHVKMEDRYFWGLPGGGAEQGETIEEAAVREAFEETGLKVWLFPFSVEKLQGPESMYRRSVTFIAAPLEGTAATGYDPEEDLVKYFELVDIKWHDFYDLDGVDSKTREDVEPFRILVDSDKFIKRAGVIVYKFINEAPYYLLVSANSDSDLLVLPQGHVDPGESAKEAAMRETLEEAGVLCEIKEHKGFFLHQNKECCYKTDIFTAEYIGDTESIENRRIIWVNFEDAMKLKLLRETRQLISECELELRSSIQAKQAFIINKR